MQPNEIKKCFIKKMAKWKWNVWTISI